jgi:LmbE family N-acetylglucosaminyl deacetylase
VAKQQTSKQYQFVRLVGEERRVGSTLASVSRHWRQDEECFLFVSPHDDDAVIGAGLLIQAALREKVPVHVAIVTDGSQGYCSLDERETISDIRRKETYAAYRALGIKKSNIHWLGYPDCQLTGYMGRRPVRDDDSVSSHGYTGLQNSFTELLRQIRARQVFLPTYADLHPDHRIVYSEMMISCFHASGAIWPELGKPLKRPPYINEMAVYCNFPTPPEFRLKTPMTALGKKLKAIMKFESQKQIASLVKVIERNGPYEYLRPADISLYHPSVYRDQFEEPPGMHGVFR